MGPEPLEAPWHLLTLGICCLAMAAVIRFSPAWLDRLFTAQGTQASSPRERKILLVATLFSAAGWFFIFWSELSVAGGGSKPLWLVITTLVWLPMAGLVLATLFLWVLFLRRFT